MLPGIGPKTLIKLQRLNIHNLTDLLYHFPHRYLDFSHCLPINQSQIDGFVTLRGKITNFQDIYTKNHKHLQIAQLTDSTGSINLIWFNQPYLANIFKVNTIFSVAGKITIFNHQKAIFAPEYGPHHTNQIIAIYPETEGLNSKWFRKTIQSNLDQLLSSISDPLPPDLILKYQLISLPTALRQIHLPQNNQQLQLARTRLATDEILSVLAKSQYLKHQQLKLPQRPIKIYPITPITRLLPFKLTPSQKQTWQEISQDLGSNTKLSNRLILGDVGSGKTILAILAAYQVHQNQQNTIILCPTKILAQQHYQNFKKYLPNTKIRLLTSQHQIKRFSTPSIIIATHAIFHHHHLPEISLLIIDEQHKFGTQQRSFLSSPGQAGPPHQITLSATPIPRTISLTIYGHLNMSHLDPLPHHLPPKSFLVPTNKIQSCYQWLNQEITTKHTQAFIVCPFISDSDNLASVKSATTEYQYLSTKIFPHLKLALIHGRSKNRDAIIHQFLQGQIDILVTTPIIEVGVDIPNANTIIIQSADRFGLSQLHQLRGRVGRGRQQAYCYLFSENTQSLTRLKFFCQHHQGQLISDYDLKHRGPGRFDSSLQHGLSSFKLADISNLKLIRFAQKIISDLIASQPPFNLRQLFTKFHQKISSTTN